MRTISIVTLHDVFFAYLQAFQIFHWKHNTSCIKGGEQRGAGQQGEKNQAVKLVTTPKSSRDLGMEQPNADIAGAF